MTQDRNPTSPPVIVVDARGLNCPLPVLRLRKRLKDVKPGEAVELLTTDRAALRDVPAFCEAQGHALLETRARDGATCFAIRKGGRD